MVSSILEILEDGEWHRYAEIATETGISEEEVLRVVHFLADFNLAHNNYKDKRVKLSPSFLELPT